MIAPLVYRYTLGSLLLLEGVIAWLVSRGILTSFPLWLLLLLLSSLTFLTFLGRNVLPWSLRISSFVLFSLMLWFLAGAQAGVLFVYIIAAALLLNFLHLPQQWWSFLLAGVAASSAFQLYLYQQHSPWHRASIFYLGLAINFSLLYLFPRFWGGRRWALYPALTCLMLTWLTNVPSIRDNSALALLFVTVGIMMMSVARRLRKQQRSHNTANKSITNKR